MLVFAMNNIDWYTKRYSKNEKKTNGKSFEKRNDEWCDIYIRNFLRIELFCWVNFMIPSYYGGKTHLIINENKKSTQ